MNKQKLIEKWESAIEAAEFYGKGKEERLISYMKDFVSDLNQLDEPEVLSQEWIESNTSPVDDEGRLYVWKRDLQNAIVPKPELPVVPTWFDEWWKDVTKGGGNLFHNIERFYDELFSSGTRKTYNYISDPDNKKKLLNIIVNELEYEVEEQKYYVLDKKGHLLIRGFSDGTVGRVGDRMKPDLYPDWNKKNLPLTEQEIKDYDDRFWSFAVKVEELEE